MKMDKNHTEKKVYAIIGMAGSGKSEAIDYLQKKFHWPKVYFGDIIFDQMKREGMEMNQDNERMIREKLREQYGMGVCAEKSLSKIERFLEQSEVVLVESLYSWDEYKILKRFFPDNFKLIAIYASPAVRFGRLQNRKVRPLKTFKEFQKRDWTEIEGTDKGGPIAVADYTLINEISLDKMYEKIDKILIKEGVVNRDIF